MRNSYRILLGDQLDEHFYRGDHIDYAPGLAKIFVTRMLTRDLFAVANRVFNTFTASFAIT